MYKSTPSDFPRSSRSRSRSRSERGTDQEDIEPRRFNSSLSNSARSSPRANHEKRSTKCIGTIKRKAGRGYGFIQPDDYKGYDVFFHSSQCRDVQFDNLREGDKLSYTEVQDPTKEMPQAFGISLVDYGTGSPPPSQGSKSPQSQKESRAIKNESSSDSNRDMEIENDTRVQKSRPPPQNYTTEPAQYSDGGGSQHSETWGTMEGGSWVPVHDNGKRRALCRHWRRGHCDRGSECHFAHPPKVEQPTRQRQVERAVHTERVGQQQVEWRIKRQRKPHPAWGSEEANEHYPHINSELNSAGVRAAVCRHWKRGHCKLGDECHFAHPEADYAKRRAREPSPERFKGGEHTQGRKTTRYIKKQYRIKPEYSKASPFSYS